MGPHTEQSFVFFKNARRKHYNAAQRRKASKTTSLYKPNPTGLSSSWKGEAPISLLHRFASTRLLHVEAAMVKVGDPVTYFIKSKDLLDQACNQSSPLY